MTSGIDAFRAPSGRNVCFGPITQGIALTRSTLGWALAAFQAEFSTRPNGPPEPSPGLSEAMPWDHPMNEPAP